MGDTHTRGRTEGAEDMNSILEKFARYADRTAVMGDGAGGKNTEEGKEDMNDIRDKEATCGNCPWFNTGWCWYRQIHKDMSESAWCAKHPRNQLALRRWMEKQLQPGTFDVSEFYEDNIDYDEVETTQTPPQKYYTQGEINKLREQLAQRDNDLVGMEMKVQTLGVAGALSEKERDELREQLECNRAARISDCEEIDELRAELEGLKRDDQDLTAAYMAGVAAGKESCAAGPWEPYQEEKHKDGEWRLIQFSDGHAVQARWVSTCEGWCHKYGSLGDINPSRVAELKEPKT